MPSINDRIGSQNVIRVLSNAAAAPTRLLNLTDVNSTLKTRDGMILIWDTATEKFYLTDTIDSGTLNVTGIVTFSNTSTSTAPTNGALVINGGVGIGKQVFIGDRLSVAGISTFASDVDINAAVDILNGLTVNSTFKSVGVTTLASAGGITTTGGDLFVGGDFSSSGSLSITGNTNVVGVITAASLDVTGNISGATLDITGNTNVVGVITAASLDVTGNISGATLDITDSVTFGSNVTIGGTLTYDDVKNVDSIGLITARSGIEIGYPGAASTFSSSGDIVLSRNLYVAGLSTFVGIATFSNDAFVAGTLTAGLIDGGSY